MNRRDLIALAAVPAMGTLWSKPSFAQSDEIRIAHVYSKTGPLDSFGQQLHTGLMMGLQYATGGTMAVNGRKLVVLDRDDQGRPDVARSLLASAYVDDKAAIGVGPTSSSSALALLPVAEENKRILILDNAVADSIVGDKWNKYLFRTMRSSSQDAISNALALDQPGVTIATLAQDYAYGREGVKAFRQTLKHAKLVHEEYLPPETTDFTAGGQRIVDRLKDIPGRKIVWILWAGHGNAFSIGDLDLKRYNIEMSTLVTDFATLQFIKGYPGMEGATYYYYGIPKNPVNDAMVAAYKAEFNRPPDFFVAGGFSAAMAIVTALKKTGGNTDANKLIAAMEGMSFETPKGTMTFRKEDHQALQSMYHYRTRSDPTVAWAVPELVHEITPSEMQLPILNNR
jgi:branched-chain amino acid transport system substrate-binding protein